MKVLYIIPCLLFVLLSGTLGQEVPSGVMEAIIPCAKETGRSDSDLEAISHGDLSSIKNFYGCFADCVAKKVGIVSEDNAFQVDVFKQKILQVVKDDVAQEYADRCAPRAGTGECKVSGKAFSCLIASVLGTMYI